MDRQLHEDVKDNGVHIKIIVPNRLATNFTFIFRIMATPEPISATPAKYVQKIG